MMKRQKLFTIILIIFSLLFLASTTYGWIIYENKTKPININTNGLKFVYNIDDELKVDDITFSINDLTFFDIDEVGETKYFVDMARMIKLEIVNTGDVDLSYTVEIVNGLYTNLTPGVLAIFSDTLLTEASFNNNLSIIDQIENFEQTNSGEIIKYQDDTASSSTVYVYIIGVQLDKAATNDFLDETYNFSLRISADSNS